MIFAELLMLLGIVGGVGVAGLFVKEWRVESEKKRKFRESRIGQKYDDLRDALKSGDYRKLDDFIVMWGADMDLNAMKYIQSRRDEMYIDADSKKSST